MAGLIEKHEPSSVRKFLLSVQRGIRHLIRSTPYIFVQKCKITSLSNRDLNFNIAKNWILLSDFLVQRLLFVHVPGPWGGGVGICEMQSQIVCFKIFQKSMPLDPPGILYLGIAPPPPLKYQTLKRVLLPWSKHLEINLVCIIFQPTSLCMICYISKLLKITGNETKEISDMNCFACVIKHLHKMDWTFFRFFPSIHCITHLILLLLKYSQ